MTEPAEPYIPTPGMCSAPINGKRTARECIEAGQCGCDEQLDEHKGESHG